MRALVYHGPWQMTLEEVDEPRPGPGEVLVDVQAVGICGSDVHGYTGSTGRRAPGVVMGHEFSGVVVALGDGVSGVQSEDEVVVSPMFPFEGKGTRYVVGVNRPGAYADYAIVHESMLIPKPTGLSFRHAAMAEPLSIAMHAAARTPIPLMGTVAVIGAGTIGLLTLQSARLKGAGKIIVTDMSEHRLALARELGADVTINIKEQDPVEVVMDMTGG
ncbi:MAG: alcohol dehydrogenase catalytic domain-containing protein, partial [Caldilineaceae bacterium]